MDLQLAKGVQDIAPEDKILMNEVVGKLKTVFELFAFAPLETPIIERYETLTAKFAAGEASDALKETFQLTDQGGRQLGLRFDLTVPLARFVAMNPTLKLPFKRYEMGVVFRDGPLKAGRTRQFWQCDFDTIGSESMLADAEILAVWEKGFSSLGIDVELKVNNRKLLNGLMEQIGVKEKESALVAIDKLDKIGKDGVKKELIERGLSSKQSEEILALIKTGVSLEQLKSRVTNLEAQQGIKELEELFSYTKQMGLKKVVFDASLARGLAYYTGTVFEAYAQEGRITSSLAGGGRWDDMIGKFMGGNRLVPAVGASFGLVPILEVLKEKAEKLGVRNKSPAQVYVMPINTIKESLALVQELRENGICADISLGKKGVSKNLEYASSLGIPYVIILGEDELKKKKVLLRDMKTGAEQLLNTDGVIKKLKM
ncbi:histidine--tRNA ligase [Candidatus Woesearchaeota archaeon]|nr:histidine--tRNA ligase [Candidatus Woesearchaeota archaeon]